LFLSSKRRRDDAASIGWGRSSFVSAETDREVVGWSATMSIGQKGELCAGRLPWCPDATTQGAGVAHLIADLSVNASYPP